MSCEDSSAEVSTFESGFTSNVEKGFGGGESACLLSSRDFYLKGIYTFVADCSVVMCALFAPLVSGEKRGIPLDARDCATCPLLSTEITS